MELCSCGSKNQRSKQKLYTEEGEWESAQVQKRATDVASDCLSVGGFGRFSVDFLRSSTKKNPNCESRVVPDVDAKLFEDAFVDLILAGAHHVEAPHFERSD